MKLQSNLKVTYTVVNNNNKNQLKTISQCVKCQQRKCFAMRGIRGVHDLWHSEFLVITNIKIRTFNLGNLSGKIDHGYDLCVVDSSDVHTPYRVPRAQGRGGETTTTSKTSDLFANHFCHDMIQQAACFVHKAK